MDGNPRLNQTGPYPNPATAKFKSSHKGLNPASTKKEDDKAAN
jgi:hypothetical protein